jgi:CshA-type fibril repeat protein
MSLRKLSISTLGAVVGFSSVVVLPLAIASPAAASPPSAIKCTPTTNSGFTDCLRFRYTGGTRAFTIPADVTSLYVNAWGGGGGGTPAAGLADPGQGGGGAYTGGLFNVTPGQTLTLQVGEGGHALGSPTYGGGGSAGTSAGTPELTGASGGGASSVSLAGSIKFVAGGGGGAGSAAALSGTDPLNPGTRDSSFVNYLSGGGGGLPAGNSHAFSARYQGGAATTSAGGSAAVANDSGCSLATAGSSLQGGNGGANTDASQGGGGGGGGGFYGGGGGGCFGPVTTANSGQGGGGGGGSSYYSGTLFAEGQSGQTSTTTLSHANAGANTNEQYETGVGIGSSGSETEDLGDGGNGEIVLQYVTGAPAALDVTTDGVGTAVQQTTLNVPDQGSATLFDGSVPATSVTFSDEGTYEVDPSTGVATFTPVLGFAGTASPVSYRVATRGGHDSAIKTYTASVAAPAGPTAGPLISSGTGTDTQSAGTDKPTEGSVILLHGATTTTDFSVTGEGSYSLDTGTGVITFTPAPGFLGDATPITYILTDAYGTTGNGTYTPHVNLPSAPNPGTEVSSGTGTDPQSVTVDPPTGGGITLLDGTTPVTTLTTTGEGSYSLDTNIITFTPDSTFVGDATPIDFRISDSYGQSGSSTYTAHVDKPGAPTAAPLTSDGTGTDVQSTNADTPAGGSVTLLDGTTPVTTLNAPGEGSYSLNTATGEITFTPVFPFYGNATAITYRLTDRYGTPSESTYTPHVNAPAAPVAEDLTSAGGGTAAQTATAIVPPSGSATLLDGSVVTTTVTVPNEGSYVLDPTSGIITFSPVLGYVGLPTPVVYQLTDAYTTTSTGTYSPTVTVPALPAPDPLTSTGAGTDDQSVTAGIPTDGSVTLLDGSTETTTVTVPDEGSYVIDPDFGVITFSPVLGFTGDATPVTFQITDAYGTTATSTYTPTVTVPVLPAPAPLTSSGSGTTPQSATAGIPAGGGISLLGATTSDEGTYTLDGGSGEITFTPALGFTGDAAPISYRLTDAYASTADGTYSPTVTLPDAPTPSPLSTYDTGAAVQNTDVDLPDGGSVTLLDAGNPTATFPITNVGVYSVADHTLTFTPASNFSGTADSVTYRVTDAYGQSGSSTYTAHVDKPGAPTAHPLTSSGIGTALQSDSATIPSGGSVTLLDGSDAVTTLTTADQGSYNLNTGTGQITFTPILGFVGDATPITYQLTDKYGTTSNSTYTPHVDAPDAPAANPLTSGGTGTTVQTTVAAIPAGGSVTLLNGSTETTTIVTTGQGSYSLNADTGVITFTPVFGFAGDATPISYRVSDAYSNSGTGSYTPTVTAPAGPNPLPLTSTGIGTAQQTADEAVPPGGSVALLDAGIPVTTLTVSGEGVYTINTTSGVITFAPASTFVGDATPITYQQTDAYGTTGIAHYTPHVNLPGAPTPSPLTSNGTGTAVQSVTLVKPAGGSVSLRDGETLTSTIRADEGRFDLDTATGIITFTPKLGVSGSVSPITYQVTDRYGSSNQSSYTAHIDIPAGPTAAPLTSTGTGNAQQHVNATVPLGGSVTLLSGISETSAVTSTGEGSYLLDPDNGAITFTPIDTFYGDATPVSYRVTDAYGSQASSAYAAHVDLPPAPRVPNDPHATVAHNGTGSLTPPIPAGGSIQLLGGVTATKYNSPRGGTWTLNETTGKITFKAQENWSGNAGSVTYRVTDAYGQHTDGVYSVVVALPVPVASATAPALLKIVTPAGTLPVTCQLTWKALGRCEVTLVYANSRGSFVVGTGVANSTAMFGTSGRIVTQVTFNALGHYLASVASIPARVNVKIRPFGSNSYLTASTRTVFVNYNLK